MKTLLAYTKPSHPVWAMAFRPLYLLTSAYAVLSILLWGFGYQGTRALPSYFWHSHRMIWGYAGAVVVAFLLTAVATWTGQPPVRGKFLMAIVGAWILARISAFLPTGLLTAFFGTAFYWLAAYGMGESVYRSRNSRNYLAVVALFLIGVSHLSFHIYLHKLDNGALANGLHAGLMLVAGFIGLIGNRIIPFFTSRRLNTPQIGSPQWAITAALVLPMISALLMMTQTAVALTFYLNLFAGVLGCVQVKRWFDKAILREPMLWTLHAGYAFSSVGLIFMAFGVAAPQTMSLGVHLLSVGGMGLLTVSMMTRTALGHTGRALYPAPKWLPTAFWLMVAAAVLRAFAAVMLYVNTTAYMHSRTCSAILFAASLTIYFVRYFPWLTQPRVDGKAG